METSVDDYFIKLFNHVREAIAIHDIEGRIVRVNGEFERLFGYREAEVRGRFTDDLIVPAERMTEATGYTEATARGETIAAETRRRRRDGSLVDISLLCAPITVDGRRVATYGIYRDITDRKAAESMREYFVNLFNTVQEAIAIQDNQGRILQVNGEFEKLFGYQASEVPGRLIDELIVPPECAAEGLRFTEAVTRGETFTVETRRRRKDGSLVDVSMICAPILIQGRQEAAYGIYRDISERKLAEARLAESHQRITESLEYARLIQKSMLPEPGAIARHFPDHFLLYRPRDLVGGDFYSLAADPGGCLLAVADCTGHGVPGAFMTMSAHAVLEQVLARIGPEDPARILAEVNQAMQGVLHQQAAATAPGRLDNGLDMALARFDPGARRVRFAGARLSLWLMLPGGAFQELPGDRHSLGYRRSDPSFPFRSREWALPPGTSCYLFTDGILDQHGGARGFGFGARRLREALCALQALPMADQGTELERILAGYRGACAQRDDITFLGLRTAPESGRE